MKTVEERAREIAERIERERYLHSQSNFDVDYATEIIAADLARAEEKGRREAVKQLLVLGADGLGVYYDTGDRIVVDRRTYLIDADVFDALLGEKEAGDEVG